MQSHFKICSKTGTSRPALGAWMYVSPAQSLGRQDWEVLELSYKVFLGSSVGQKLAGLSSGIQMNMNLVGSWEGKVVPSLWLNSSKFLQRHLSPCTLLNYCH